MRLQKLDELDLLRIASGALRHALHLRGMLGDPTQVRHFLAKLLGPPPNGRLQHAMHDEVGITPDGRCEMTVSLARKSVVGIDVRTVQGALHRTQHERRDKRFFTPSPAARQHTRYLEGVPGDEPVGVDFREPREFLKNRNQPVEALAGRLLVHAVHARESGIAQVSGNRLVRGYHGLLDELRRLCPLAEHHVERRPRLVKPHLRLNRVEVEAPCLLAQRHALLCQVGQELDSRLRFPVDICRIDHLLRLVVCQARARANERRIDVRRKHAAFFVEHHVDRHRAPIFIWPQRAHVVRKLFGQHGNHTVDQVNAGCTTTGVHIHRTSPGNVMRDVGDVHAEPPTPARRNSIACLDAVERHGVVVIACIDGVDGEDNPLAQVAITRIQRLFRRHARMRSLLQRRRRKCGLELVARDYEVDGNALVVMVPQHFHDDARGCLFAAGIGRDGHANNGAVRHVGVLGALREDVVGYARVFGHHDAERLRHFVAPYHFRMRPLHNAHDAGFSFARSL